MKIDNSRMSRNLASGVEGMHEFGRLFGVVYILENAEAKRVKVGMTTSSIGSRIIDINRKWMGINATCQICGGRRFLENPNGLFPFHQVSGNKCAGSYALPFEKDSTIANSRLYEMKTQLTALIGSAKGSITRRINSLENRIKRFQKLENPVGEWELKVIYYTYYAEAVEIESHDLLSNSLDDRATFGEVFNCSLIEAEKAIESTLDQMELLSSARKETRETLAAQKNYAFM